VFAKYIVQALLLYS